MELSKFEIRSASAGDLKAMISMCEQELKNRSVARRDELIQMVCDAMNTLHKEFPMVELRVGCECSECGVDDNVDVMEHFCGIRPMVAKDFYIW